MIVDSPHNWNNQDAYGNQQAMYQSVDAQLDDDALGHDIDSQVAAEMHGARDSYQSFDPDDARSFDAGLPGQQQAAYVNGYDETDLAQAGRSTQQQVDTHSHQYVDESLAVSGSYDPYGTEAV